MLRDKKIVKLEKESKKELLGILQDRLSHLDYDISELDEKLRVVNGDIKELQSRIQKHKSELKSYMDRLEIDIKNNATKSVNLLKNRDIIGFSDNMANIIERYAREYIKELDTHSDLIDMAKIDEIMRSINFRQTLFDFIPSLAGGASNVLNMVDNLLVAVPKLMIITKALKIGLRVIEAGGNLIGDFFMDRSYKNAVDDIATLISAATKEYIQKFVDENIFTPLQIELSNRKDSISDILRAKTRA